MTESLLPSTSAPESQPDHVANLRRIEITEMSKAELDLAMAFSLISKRVVVPLFEAIKLENDKTFVRVNNQWRPFSATSNWDDFGLVISNTEVVMGTHSADGVEGAPSRNWYSAHAFFSGTEFNSGTDIRIAVGRAVAALLRKDF